MAEKRLTSEKIKTAERLKGIRERMGYTQEGFANELNISLSAYKKIESAENNVSVNVLKKLNGLQVSSDYVLFGEYKDVDDTWKIIQNCSEEDKMYLYIMLMLHFTKGDVADPSRKDKIFKLLEKVLEEKEV